MLVNMFSVCFFSCNTIDIFRMTRIFQSTFNETNTGFQYCQLQKAGGGS